uniref:MH2 domain-containing protein n=1 Tax=Plectus sambesii TaxID=2011161 RepID=A0A914UXD8_9BILA
MQHKCESVLYHNVYERSFFPATTHRRRRLLRRGVIFGAPLLSRSGQQPVHLCLKSRRPIVSIFDNRLSLSPRARTERGLIVTGRLAEDNRPLSPALSASATRMASTRSSQCYRQHGVSESRHISRSGIVHGPFSNAGQAGSPRDDMWFDVDRFQLDHLNEVLEKLEAGGIDDEIWGKIICMERSKRVAKAYLRKTTIIVDGGCEEFDGKTLGFNHFSNPFRDEQTEEMRTKIADGVIIKMDHHGNVKAMARGSSPVFVQGWRDSRYSCFSERVVQSQGKLINIGPTHKPTHKDEDRVVKIFDMRKFKSAVEREMAQPVAKAKELLMKTCIRLALVKDGGGNDPMKTPCWFMVVNLVALDMLKSKLPTVLNSAFLHTAISPTVQRHQRFHHASADDVNVMSRASNHAQQLVASPSASGDLLTNPHALTQIIAAAMKQVNYAPQPPPPAIHIPTPEQLAHIASTLALGSLRSSPRSAYGSMGSVSSSPSPSGRRGNGKSQNRKAASTLRDGGGRWDCMAQSIDALFEPNEDGDDFPDHLPPSTPTSHPVKNKNFTLRPKLTETLFHAPPTARKSTSNWSCQSITSDYDRDSNKDLYDSTGSWSSGSRGSSTNSNRVRSVVSERELRCRDGEEKGAEEEERVFAYLRSRRSHHFSRWLAIVRRTMRKLVGRPIKSVDAYLRHGGRLWRPETRRGRQLTLSSSLVTADQTAAFPRRRPVPTRANSPLPSPTAPLEKSIGIRYAMPRTGADDDDDALTASTHSHKVAPEARSSSPSVLSEAASESQTSDFQEEMRQIRRSSSAVPEQPRRNNKPLYGGDGDSLGYGSDLNFASVSSATRNRTLLKRNRPLMAQAKPAVVAANKRLNGMLEERYEHVTRIIIWD